MNILLASDLSFIYRKSSENIEEEIEALKNINLEVKKGEFLAILGRNGSGKSTLAKHINALLFPSSGSIFIDGMNSKNEENLWEIRKTAGMVFQNPDNQIVASIVEEDVAFGLENIAIESKEIRKRVDESLDFLGMSEYKRVSPSMLSGGQKQKIALAGVLSMKPKIIVLDESTAMLDPIGRKEVIEAVLSLKKDENITIIFITHFMEEAVLADRVALFDDGDIVKTASPKEIFRDVEMLKSLDLDVPQVTELAYNLRKEGVKIADDILTVDEMVGALCQLL